MMNQTVITGNYSWYKNISVFLTALLKITHKFSAYMIKENMNIYKYIQSLIIVLLQHVLFTPVINIRVSYNKNTINIHILVQKCMLKPYPGSCNERQQDALFLGFIW
jgi:5'(3')-deoxyribonucleotidase